MIGNGPYCNPYLVTSDDVHLITTAFGANRRVQIRGNDFIIDSSDDKPVRMISARAFLGKSYPIALEPGHDLNTVSAQTSGHFLQYEVTKASTKWDFLIRSFVALGDRLMFDSDVYPKLR